MREKGACLHLWRNLDLPESRSVLNVEASVQRLGGRLLHVHRDEEGHGVVALAVGSLARRNLRADRGGHGDLDAGVVAAVNVAEEAPEGLVVLRAVVRHQVPGVSGDPSAYQSIKQSINKSYTSTSIEEY